MTDININVDLGVDQALLDKLKKQRAESRQQERPFVPKTIADSSVLPDQETRAGSTDFSTNIYTSNQSLSRNRDTTGIVPVATSSFSRQTFTQAYNQAQVKAVDAQGRKRYYDPGQRIWVDEPNRLLSRKITDNSWYLAFDYADTFPSGVIGSAGSSAFLSQAPVFFYGDTNLSSAIVDNIGAIGDSYKEDVTILIWLSKQGTTSALNRVPAPFSTFGVEAPVFKGTVILYPDDFGSSIAVYGVARTESFWYQNSSLEGTIEADVWLYETPSNSAGSDVVQFSSDFSLVLDDGNYSFRFNIGCIFASPNNRAYTRLQVLSNRLQGQGVREIPLDFSSSGWYRVSLTFYEDVIHIHFNGEWTASYNLETPSGYDGRAFPFSFFAESEYGVYYVIGDQKGKPARLGRSRFVAEALYGDIDYEVAALT